MATHEQRLTAARDSIDFICSRSDDQMKLEVPNCPGWTVYNAAVHVGRVGVAWHSMITATPDDPESRTRGYADAESRGSGHRPDELAGWARAAIDALDDDVDRPCYFSMTGGSGTVGLWGWHAASELAVHRLDIEDAVGSPHEIEPHLAFDAIDYTASFFLPAMASVTNSALAPLDVIVQHDGANVGSTQVATTNGGGLGANTITGDPVDILLALWGREHKQIEIGGDPEIFERWHALPGMAFQFGTWD